MNTERWFEVSVKSKIGKQFAVLASSQEEADAQARTICGDDFFHAHDVCHLPDHAELLWSGYSRSRREREWLVRYQGRQVHVYERLDSMFPQCRFQGSVPGRGQSGFTLWDAACIHVEYDVDPDWFTKQAAEGRLYYPTGYAA